MNNAFFIMFFGLLYPYLKFLVKSFFSIMCFYLYLLTLPVVFCF